MINRSQISNSITKGSKKMAFKKKPGLPGMGSKKGNTPGVPVSAKPPVPGMPQFKKGGKVKGKKGKC